MIKPGTFHQLIEDVELAKLAMVEKKWGAAIILWKMALRIAVQLDLKENIEAIQQQIKFCTEQKGG